MATRVAATTRRPRTCSPMMPAGPGVVTTEGSRSGVRPRTEPAGIRIRRLRMSAGTGRGCTAAAHASAQVDVAHHVVGDQKFVDLAIGLGDVLLQGLADRVLAHAPSL